MPMLSTTRNSLDSFVYWGTLIFLACFVTYFLNSMIELTNAEAHQYDVTTTVETTVTRTKVLRSHNSSVVKAAPLPVNDRALDDMSY